MGALEVQWLAIVIPIMGGPCTVAAVIHKRSIDTLEMVDTIFLAVTVHTVPIRQGSAFKNTKITSHCMTLASISF